ncbi:hypothetical protein GQ53DRAFT_809503 [Thozetella sp. PMI_491]|nr:hypothetical protein GQ53DRAFT_809503 [Thozetella sp. PMI_491]
MERAFVANAIKHQLLVNHRAHGGLERLAPTFFYNSEMVAFDSNPTIPSTAGHLKAQYLNSLLSCDARVAVPRLIVHTKEPARLTTAPRGRITIIWIVDPDFQCVSSGGKIERGSILSMSPYKEAEERVGVRTIDTVQGHEADFVFVDLVHSKASQFLDDPNWLCVASTQARQAEILVMHPGLTMTTTGHSSRHLRRILDEYNKIGQVARLGRTAAGPKKHMPEDEVFEMMALRLDDQATLAVAAKWIAGGQQPAVGLAGQQIASQVRQVSTETQEELDRQNDIDEEGVEPTDKGVKGIAQLPALRTVAVHGFNTRLDGGQSWW